MSDFARLQEALAKLGTRVRGPGEGRHLKGEDANVLLAAFVEEIDETILPRRLIFSTKGGTEFQIAVANRRVQALLSPAPKVKGTNLSQFADQPLSDVEEPVVAALRGALLVEFEKAGTVSVRSQRLTGVNFGSDVGVPAGVLAKAWEIVEREVVNLDPPELLGSYLEWLGNRAIAWLRIEGEEVTDQKGKVARVEALSEQAALFLDSYFSKFDDLFSNAAGPFVTVLASEAEDSKEAILFIEIAELSAFVVVKDTAIAEAVTHWQSLIVD